MACGSSSAPSEQHLNTMSGTTDYAWFTSWMPATGLDFVNPPYARDVKTPSPA